MTGAVDWLASIFEDLIGCLEEDETCKKKARSYAAKVIYIGAAAIIIIVAIKGYSFIKGGK